MDYFDIVKRALKVTWKYKALWVLGFFVGGGAGGGGTSGYQSSLGNPGSSGTSGTTLTNDYHSALSWIEANLVLAIAVVSFLVVLGIVMWVLSLAAQGGLVHLVGEAEENREVRLRAGWRSGFQHWGRIFMIDFLIGLPVVAIALLMAGLLAVTGLGAASGSGTAATGGFAALCCGLPVMVIAIVVVGVLLGIVRELALRYGVLEDVTYGQALLRGWSDITGKRGAFVFMLVMILPGFVFAAIVGVIALVLAVPAIFLFIGGKVVSGAALIVLLVLILMVPGAAYGTFTSSAWTLFFRRMNGMERTPEVREPAPVRGDLLPPAPMPPAPPAPPAPESPPYA